MVLEIRHCGSCSDGRRGVTRHTDSSDEGDGVIICTFNCSNCAAGVNPLVLYQYGRVISTSRRTLRFNY